MQKSPSGLVSGFGLLRACHFRAYFRAFGLGPRPESTPTNEEERGGKEEEEVRRRGGNNLDVDNKNKGNSKKSELVNQSH